MIDLTVFIVILVPCTGAAFCIGMLVTRKKYRGIVQEYQAELGRTHANLRKARSEATDWKHLWERLDAQDNILKRLGSGQTLR